MSPGPALEKFNDPRTPQACEAYPAWRCWVFESQKGDEMNRREKLMYELSDIEGDLDAVKDFVDAVESDFNTIAELLEGVTIDSLDNIYEALKLAKKVGGALY